MELIVKNNIVDEVEKIDDKIKEKSVKYSGLLLSGEAVNVYDLDNGSIKPLVKYLLEGDQKKGGLLIYIVTGVIIVILLFIGYSIFGGKKEEKPVVKETPIINSVPINSNTIVESDKTKEENKKELEEIKKQKEELEKQNQLLINQQQAKEYSNTTSGLAIEKLNWENEKIKSSLNDKIEEIKNLNIELEKLKKENIDLQSKSCTDNPDQFILYLGQTLFDICEKNKDDKCKEIYYNYIQNAKQ